MNKILGLALAGALSAAALPTMAADRPMPYKAPPPLDPIFTWTGFYIGAHAGAAWADYDWFVPLTPINIAGGCGGCPATAGAHSDSSWLAGAQVGFNYQVGMWVWGAEAQFSWTRLQSSNTSLLFAPIVDHSKTDYFGTVAARLGVAMDRTLVFVKGGGAWAHNTFFTTFPGLCGGGTCQTTDDTRWGWMVGIGAEWAFSPNWSIKLEYDYLGFGRERETLAPTAACGGCLPFQYDIKQSIQLVKAGINYRFGPM